MLTVVVIMHRCYIIRTIELMIYKHQQEAIIDQLPEAVGCILQDAINKANQGLTNWVFKHRSMKLLSILTLPYVLPIDIAYGAFLK